MSTQPGPPGIQTLTQMLIDAMGKVAAAHNTTVIGNWQRATAAAADSTSRGFPTPAPPLPIVWTVDEAAITAAEAAPAGTGDWSHIFIESPYVPPPPPPVNQPNPAIDPVGQQVSGNLYADISGDLLPDGAPWVNSRGSFVHHLVVYPFGREAWWIKQEPPQAAQ